MKQRLIAALVVFGIGFGLGLGTTYLLLSKKPAAQDDALADAEAGEGEVADPVDSPPPKPGPARPAAPAKGPALPGGPGGSETGVAGATEPAGEPGEAPALEPAAEVPAAVPGEPGAAEPGAAEPGAAEPGSAEPVAIDPTPVDVGAGDPAAPGTLVAPGAPPDAVPAEGAIPKEPPPIGVPAEPVVAPDPKSAPANWWEGLAGKRCKVDLGRVKVLTVRDGDLKDGDVVEWKSKFGNRNAVGRLFQEQETIALVHGVATDSVGNPVAAKVTVDRQGKTFTGVIALHTQGLRVTLTPVP